MLTREVAKDGGVFTYRYDASGRCVNRTGLDRYNEKRLRFVDGARVTEVTDSYDRVFTYQYLPSGQITLEVDPIGGRRTTEYDERGRIAVSVDATGATTRYLYDEAGNRSSLINGVGNTTTFTFNEHHQPLSMTDAKGGIWRRSYDSRHRLTTTADPLGNQWRFHYDDDGNLTEIVNPKGDRKSQRYRNGILQATTDWLRNVTQYQFDAFGRVVERRGALGEVLRFRYDRIGNPVQVELPDGSTRSAEYDQARNLTRFTDGDGRTTYWRYGPCKRLLERRNPTGRTVRYSWGTERGRLDQVINEKGETYRFFRDVGGRIVRDLAFDGAERHYKYDAEGHTIEYLNANGETIRFERDGLHRVVGQHLPDGDQIRYAFDPLGDLAEAVTVDTAVSYERDPFGRVVREVQGKEWVASRYDAIGNLVRTETSLGHVVTYELDANGHATKVSTLDDKTVSFTRNAYGEETSRIMPGGARMEQRFDPIGRLAAQRVLAPWELGRDAESGSPAAAGLVSRTYTYAPGGTLTAIDDHRWGRISYEYDPAERLLEAIRERGVHETFEYDATDDLTTIRTDRNTVRAENLVYGPGNRLLQRGSTQYEFDAEGRQISRTDDADADVPKVWRYQWNALDRLESITRPDGQVWRYKYRCARSTRGKGRFNRPWFGG